MGQYNYIGYQIEMSRVFLSYPGAGVLFPISLPLLHPWSKLLGL
uniref:Uncharacterized protein n=1 Tax=viral metagenome TaxID=1070528 RepID=A0A6M3J3D0_9ZZZZ